MTKVLRTLQIMSVLGIFLSIFADPEMSNINATVIVLAISIITFIFCEYIIIKISDSDKFGT